MNKHIFVKIICGCIAFMLLFALAGCGSKEEDESSGVIVERTFGSPVPSQEPSFSSPQSAEPSPSESAVSAVKLEDGADALAYINSDAVNVREINSTTGTVLGQLSAGSVISVIKKEYGNGWSQISYNGKEAFIAAQYITLLTNESSIPMECTATVNSADVNMRADSTTDALVISKLANGTVVEVIKRDAGHNWSMIFHENRVAFVASRYLTFEGGSSPSPA